MLKVKDKLIITKKEGFFRLLFCLLHALPLAMVARLVGISRQSVTKKICKYKLNFLLNYKPGRLTKADMIKVITNLTYVKGKWDSIGGYKNIDSLFENIAPTQKRSALLVKNGVKKAFDNLCINKKTIDKSQALWYFNRNDNLVRQSSMNNSDHLFSNRLYKVSEIVDELKDNNVKIRKINAQHNIYLMNNENCSFVQLFKEYNKLRMVKNLPKVYLEQVTDYSSW